jgi:hypothetical protein
MTYDIRRALVHSALEKRFGKGAPQIIMGYYDEPEVRKPLWTNNFPSHNDDYDVWGGVRRTQLGEWTRAMFELGNHFTRSVSSLIMAYHSEKAPECNVHLTALFNMPRLDEPMTRSSNA